MGTIAATTKELICVVDENGIGLSINEILERIHEIHAGCKTTKSCVSWYLSKAKTGDLKNFTGVLPQDRARSTGSAKVTAPTSVPVVELTEAEKWRDAAMTIMDSTYSEPKVIKYMAKVFEAVNIAEIITAERVEAEHMVEEVVLPPETVNEDEDDAIPLFDDEAEELSNISDDELAELVA